MVNNIKLCKICHIEEKDDEKNLCHPCKCKGSMKYIHKYCLFLCIKTNNKEFCSICKYKYRFKDIYKENTPETIPIKIALLEIYESLKKFFYLFLKHLFLSSLLIFVCILNGYVCLQVLEIQVTHFCSLKFILLCVVGFICTVASFFLSQVNLQLYKYTRSRINRRNMRIDTFNVVSSMTSDVLSNIEDETESVSIENSSRIRLNFFSSARASIERENTNSLENVINNRTIITDTRNYEENLNLQNNNLNVSVDEEINSEISEEYPEGFEDIFVFNVYGLNFIFKCINISLIVFIVSKIHYYLNFELPKSNFVEWIKEVRMYEFSKHVIIFYLLFFLVMMACKSNKILYRMLSVVNLMIIVFIVLIFADGLVVHYIFSIVFNNGPLMDFNYFKYLSVPFHIGVGIWYSSLFTFSLSIYSEKFRPGVFWQFAEPRTNYMNALFKTASTPLYKIYFTIVKKLFIRITSFYILLKCCQPEIHVININFNINNFTKFMLAVKLFFTFRQSYNIFLRYVIYFNVFILRFLSRLLNMNNFLFNEQLEIGKNSTNLKWCPNQNKSYYISAVRKKEHKKISNENIKNLYCKETNSEYSIFYVPKYFVLFLIILFLAAGLNASLVFKFFMCSVRYITRYIPSVKEYDDLIFIATSGMVSYLIFSIYKISQFKKYLKTLFLNLFINVVWPLWITFLTTLLYGDESFNIMPSKICVSLLASSSLLNFCLKKFVFPLSIENYTYKIMIAKMYRFLINFTIMIAFIKYAKRWIVYGTLSTLEIPYLYVLIVLILLIYARGYLIRSIKQFADQIKRKHFLIEREIINYGD